MGDQNMQFTCGLLILIHGIISLPDVTSYTHAKKKKATLSFV